MAGTKKAGFSRKSNRSGGLLAAMLLLLAWLVPAAQAAEGGPRRLVVIVTLASADYPSIRGFRDYLEASDLPVEVIGRSLNGDISRAAALIEELRVLRPALVFTQTTLMAQRLLGNPTQPGLGEIPLVFTLVSDPVGAGLAPPPAAPDQPILSGRNHTGTIHVLSEEVLFRGLLAYRPIRRLVTVYDEQEDSNRRRIVALRRAAEGSGVTLETVSILRDQDKLTPQSLTRGLEAIAANPPDMLYVIPMTALAPLAKHFYAEATRLGLPTFCAIETHIIVGCMAGLMPPLYSLGQFTAHKALKILRGEATPGAIAIETLPRFSYTVNVPVMQALRAYPSMQVLQFAHLHRP